MQQSKPMTFYDCLTLLFIGLKLCDQIEWSWWWVLSPAWGSLAIYYSFVGLAKWRYRKRNAQLKKTTSEIDELLNQYN
jgi:hypothetical protein